MSSDDTDRCGPDDVEVDDEVRFEYGSRPYTSRKEVNEVLDWGVRVDGGGMVSYRDIIQIIPATDRNCWSRDAESI